MSLSIQSKDDLVNCLFEQVDSHEVKASELMSFINLFSEGDFRDAVSLLIAVQQRRLTSSDRPHNVSKKVKDAVETTQLG